MTVTRTLLRPDQVSPETRDRVRGAIASLGYVPDRAAGSLSTRRSGFIALILPTLSNGNFAAMAEGLTDAIRPGGFELLIGHTRYGIDEEERQIRTILQRRPEAVILTATTHAPDVRRLVANAAIPIIEIADLPAEPIGDAIGFSNHDVGIAAARHLLSLGHRRIAALGPRRTATRVDTRGEARLEGFALALRQAGVSASLVRATAEIPVSFEQGAHAMAALLEDAPDVTAVFAISDLLAVGAMMECRRRGVDIPASLSLIGFGDFEIGRQVVPPLTTIGVDFRRLGEEAGRIVTSLLTQGIAIPERSDVGFELIERRTTAPR